MGLGYAAHRFASSVGAPPPSAGEAAPAPALQTEPDESTPSAASPSSDESTVGSASDDESDDETAPATATDGGYYVQVASYKAEADAAEYAATLSARGLAAQSSADPSSSWHWVRLGPFPTRGEAEKARFKLKLHERQKAYVTPRSNGKYHVQVGSFVTLAEAEGVAKRFTGLGHATKISRIKMGERRWHCVRIGPFDAAQEAADYQELVKGVAATESVVIPFGPPKT
jgi:cell division protein FtsN